MQTNLKHDLAFTSSQLKSTLHSILYSMHSWWHVPSVCVWVCVCQRRASQVCFPQRSTLAWGMFRAESQWPKSGCTEQLDGWPERPVTHAAGPYRPTGTGLPCVLCVSVWAWLCVCKCQQLLSSHQFPLSHLYRNMKSRLELASGTLILFSLFALVSTPLQAEKHLSSKSLQTTTVLNLIKDIADNGRAIKQQPFQRSTRAYIPVAQRGKHWASQVSDFSK